MLMCFLCQKCAPKDNPALKIGWQIKPRVTCAVDEELICLANPNWCNLDFGYHHMLVISMLCASLFYFESRSITNRVFIIFVIKKFLAESARCTQKLVFMQIDSDKWKTFLAAISDWQNFSIFIVYSSSFYYIFFSLFFFRSFYITNQSSSASSSFLY